MYKDPLQCNVSFAETNAVVHMMHQVVCGKLAKAEFFVGLYGGFFGAGMGIMLMASLQLTGFNDIHLNFYSDLKLIILSGSDTDPFGPSPFLILSTNSIPSITFPKTVY